MFLLNNLRTCHWPTHIIAESMGKSHLDLLRLRPPFICSCPSWTQTCQFTLLTSSFPPPLEQQQFLPLPIVKLPCLSLVPVAVAWSLVPSPPVVSCRVVSCIFSGSYNQFPFSSPKLTHSSQLFPTPPPTWKIHRVHPFFIDFTFIAINHPPPIPSFNSPRATLSAHPPRFPPPRCVRWETAILADSCCGVGFEAIHTTIALRFAGHVAGPTTLTTTT
jgi:hypothetical protein